jgi:hypothetical protein
MKYDIYFHNDFDGRASASVVLAFLRSRGDDIERYISLKFDILPQWLNDKFMEKNTLMKGVPNPSIVVDFPFHPGATFWFDHHVRPFRKPGWEKKYKRTAFRHYDDTYASACHLVYDSLQKNFGWKPPKHLRELVTWLDICDGANYKSAKQTIDMKEAGIQVNNFVEERADDFATTVWTVKSLAEKSVTAFAREPKVRKEIAKLRRGTESALDFYRTHMEITGKVVVTDLSGFRYGDLAHFGPYYLHPKKLYAIRFHPFPGKPSLYHINVSANPWRRKQNKKNIGDLMKRYGGGGHAGVGGTEIKTRKKTLEAIQEFITFLNT